MALFWVMEHTRKTLIQRLKHQSDDQAWETFVEAYSGYIYTVLRRMGVIHEETLDLQQDILLKLWKKLPDFDYQPERAKFRTWLCSVIRNTALNRIQSMSKEKARIDTLDEVKPVTETEIDTLMNQEWKTYIANQAMSKIRDKFNADSIDIFERSLKGEPVQDIAKRFDLKENTIYRIKNKVKERLILEIAELRRELE